MSHICSKQKPTKSNRHLAGTMLCSEVVPISEVHVHSFDHHIIVKTVGKFLTKHLLKPVGGREVERYFLPKPQVENG